jgi:uncharacterized repeat protein (TIGR03803 family)
MRGKTHSMGLSAMFTIVTVTLLVTSTFAATEKVLYSFNNNGKDGHNPYASLIFDTSGNLFGTTLLGGAHDFGTVFELTPKTGGGWTEKILHNFNGPDGYYPQGGVILDASGNLYGTTSGGGAHGVGTVFELTRKAGGGWTEKVLHSFNAGGKDGYDPYAGLTFDVSGNLYGTTDYGGTENYGTVVELTPQKTGGWTEKVLYSFKNDGRDGFDLYAGVVLDKSGNLYGTTYGGGAYGYGTVFELTPKAGGGWTEKVLHSFNANSKDGYQPLASLIVDASGNLYGTTLNGGDQNGYGTVFELTPKKSGGWTEKILHTFNGSTDGLNPYTSLIFDASGNLYGTTAGGGVNGGGTVFNLTPTRDGGWKEKVLYGFNFKDGSSPYASLIFETAGKLYGTTYVGGAYDYGTVFAIAP